MKLASWTHNGEAFLDRWTLVHLAFWFVIGANMEALHVDGIWRWALIIVGAYAWEVIETGLEKYTNVVAAPESYLNRWVSDPLMAVLGGLLGMWLLG
jgi:hypothetical protein